MKKIWFAIGLIVLIIIVFFALCNTANRWQDGQYQCARIGDKYYNLEVAAGNQSRTIGLSKYQSIDANQGMLFVFGTDNYHSFWMKDTVFPIDIIWLDTKFTVVHQLTMNVEPDPAHPQQSYAPPKPARYVIELKKNEAGDVEIGDTIELVAQDKCEKR